jgi:hypothetical protein
MGTTLSCFSAVDEKGRTPLQIATQHGHKRSARFLLQFASSSSSSLPVSASPKMFPDSSYAVTNLEAMDDDGVDRSSSLESSHEVPSHNGYLTPCSIVTVAAGKISNANADWTTPTKADHHHGPRYSNLLLDCCSDSPASRGSISPPSRCELDTPTPINPRNPHAASEGILHLGRIKELEHANEEHSASEKLHLMRVHDLETELLREKGVAQRLNLQLSSARAAWKQETSELRVRLEKVESQGKATQEHLRTRLTNLELAMEAEHRTRLRLEGENSDLQKEKTSLTSSLRSVESAMAAEKEARLRLNKEAEKLSARTSELQNEKTSLSSSLKRIESEMAAEKEARLRADKEAEKLSASNSELQKEKTSLSFSLKRIESEMAAEQRLRLHIEREFEKLSARNSELHKEKTSLISSLKTLELGMEAESAARMRLEGEVAKLSTRNSELTKENAALASTVDDLRSECAARDSLAAENVRLQYDVELLESELGSLTDTVLDLQRLLRRKREHEAEEASKSAEKPPAKMRRVEFQAAPLPRKKISCSVCGVEGHNSRGHEAYVRGVRKEAERALSMPWE